MAEMDIDLVASLTQEGPHFENKWSTFMFNVEEAMQLKKSTKEQIMAVMQAGSKYQGTGWSTGKASKKLYDLSGVAIVKAKIDSYRDCWLYTVSLLTGVDLPTVELPQDCAGAAFAILTQIEGRQREEPGSPTSLSDNEEEILTFDWDEKEEQLPRELQALWHRAQTGEQRIQIRKLLEAHPRLKSPRARRTTISVRSGRRNETSFDEKSVNRYSTHYVYWPTDGCGR